ncbi:hypothetical protein K505DRAFT_417702 [Melanomma pulvis-pyrius CBS 109.77]|uniref:Uncharacterized protein n=1 Tax=Melanomma pulvis-pyrius CBS 109.77 TaxID=1314802 RepID=A0A6A6XBD5_9PLEO|nr:hypothetical protein K505DRAFT_417702 [Melanomma pulvis-pyrius CBS 109.77]
MGLPVWRSPSPAAKDALKADLTAPARSPIRRRSSLVGRRARSSRSPRSPRLLDHNLAAADELFTVERPGTRRFPSGRPRLPPPVPESRNYTRQSESARDLGEGLVRLRRERYYRALYDSNMPSLGAMSRHSRQLPALTPNFAPAAASRDPQEIVERAPYRHTSPYHRALPPPRSRVAWSETRTDRLGDPSIGVETGDDDSSDNAVMFPPLRRMGRRTIADGPLPSSSLRESWSPATTLDGLGDRERSLSPLDDHWENMLNTVAPDPIAPTADSSFASAAASASFSTSHPSSRAGSSNSNSAASSRTHLTIPSQLPSPPVELFIRACDTSDDDTESDTEDDMVVYPRLSSRPMQGLADAPPRNFNGYSRRVHDQSREVRAYMQDFYGGTTPRDSPQPEPPLTGQLDGPVDEPSTRDDEITALDQELRDARALLERLSRRDDISEEFWASVGLTRPLADRVERIQQRERL